MGQGTAPADCSLKGIAGLHQALLAVNQHPADEGIDGVEGKGQLQPLLAHQGRKGRNGTFRSHWEILQALKSNGKCISPCHCELPICTRELG